VDVHEFEYTGRVRHKPTADSHGKAFPETTRGRMPGNAGAFSEGDRYTNKKRG